MSRLCVLSVVAAGLVASANAAVLQGKVTNQTGKAINGAIVKLIPLGISDTTAADGLYSITSGATAVNRLMTPTSRDVSLRNGILEVNLRTDAPVKVEIFDTKGGKIHTEELRSFTRGIYHMDVSRQTRGNRVLLIKVTVGGSVAAFHYASLEGMGSMGGTISEVGSLARVAGATDSIIVSAAGYKPRTVATPSLDATVNVTLDTAIQSSDWRIPKNEPHKSAGCGKALGVLPKSGTYKISTVSGRGEFIINMPTNYSKDTPYRLIFGNHCMGGSAIKVAGTDNGQDQSAHFYHIKTQADKDNVQAIYVALQGDGGGTWNLPNDSKFWNDVLVHVETNLCVDTTRVFVTGFSFGAMFSYVLSLQYPEKIRAVATYAPANYNMTQPTNRHIPIAYYQTTGTSDGTCPWVNNDAQKKGGKYCLLQHVEDNGCKGEPKLATNGTHVTTEFTGCKEGYPVKFSSFKGGHECRAYDQGSSDNWIQKEAWEFFKQF